mmetsp:Transcript_17991/g.47520  ORF Transcript_17991/g.47520 Transcript_17991/m.47520 type:complete len:271 (+) Transcript_17991:3-815(+)
MDYLLAYDDPLGEEIGEEEVRQRLLGMSEADEQLALEILSAYEAQGGAGSPSPAAPRPTPTAGALRPQDGGHGSPPSSAHRWLLEHEDLLSDVAPTRTSEHVDLSDEALEAALAECALSSSSTPDLPRGSPPSDLPCGGPPPGVPPLEGSPDLPRGGRPAPELPQSTAAEEAAAAGGSGPPAEAAHLAGSTPSPPRSGGGSPAQVAVKQGSSSPPPAPPRAAPARGGSPAPLWTQGAGRTCFESEGAAPSSPTPDGLRRSSPGPAAVVQA